MFTNILTATVLIVSPLLTNNGEFKRQSPHDVDTHVSQALFAGTYEDADDYFHLATGQWTRCIAVSGGKKYNIAKARTQDGCMNLSIRCTGDNKVRWSWYGHAVLIEPPYELCNAF